MNISSKYIKRLSTRTNFGAWLKKNERSIVGYAGEDIACPIATFIKTQADNIIFAAINSEDVFWTVMVPPWNSTLDIQGFTPKRWMLKFIEAVDEDYDNNKNPGCKRYPITGKQALKALRKTYP